MKRIAGLVVLFILAMTVTLYAQEKKERKESGPTYTAVGVSIPLLYFIEAKDSSENVGVKFKLPFKDDYGIEVGFNSFEIPITSYSLGTASYSGNGTENYTNIYLDFVYFMPFYRYFQAKVGFDYYRYLNGMIADSPTGANGGTLYTEQGNSMENQFGLNIGANLDVNVYDDFLVMTGVAYRFFLSDQASTGSGILEFNIGLGQRLE